MVKSSSPVVVTQSLVSYLWRVPLACLEDIEDQWHEARVLEVLICVLDKSVPNQSLLPCPSRARMHEGVIEEIEQM